MEKEISDSIFDTEGENDKKNEYFVETIKNEDAEKNEIFIQMVKEKLDEMKIPQYELANRLGISPQIISQYMTGIKIPSPTRKKQILKILNMEDITVSEISMQEMFKKNVMFIKLAASVIFSGDTRDGIFSTLKIEKKSIPNISVIDLKDDTCFDNLHELLLLGYEIYCKYRKLSPDQASMLNLFVNIESIINPPE